MTGKNLINQTRLDLKGILSYKSITHYVQEMKRVQTKLVSPLELFSFEYAKIIGFASTSIHDWLSDWLKKVVHFFFVQSEAGLKINSSAWWPVGPVYLNS